MRHFQIVNFTVIYTVLASLSDRRFHSNRHCACVTFRSKRVYSATTARIASRASRPTDYSRASWSARRRTCSIATSSTSSTALTRYSVTPNRCRAPRSVMCRQRVRSCKTPRTVDRCSAICGHRVKETNLHKSTGTYSYHFKCNLLFISFFFVVHNNLCAMRNSLHR